MHERVPFEYVVLRIVPRVERGECLNAGVVLICRPERFLAASILFDRERLIAFAPYLDADVLDELQRQIETVPRIANGEKDAGPIAALEMGERWHWLAAPASTLIQPGPVHTGLTGDPERELSQLFREMVLTD